MPNIRVKQLIKYTVQDSQAFHTLTASLQKIKQIADWLNESKRHVIIINLYEAEFDQLVL